jgi:hypothetical protein
MTVSAILLLRHQVVRKASLPIAQAAFGPRQLTGMNPVGPDNKRTVKSMASTKMVV